VRIDSGELGPLARSVRKILDEAGLQDVQIILSGDLDEYRIKSLLSEGTPVDSFGVGTQLGTSADAPYLGGVYKLVAEDSEPKIKLSTGKVTLPGVKQVHRFDDGGVMDHDVIALEDEEIEGGRPLLAEVMRGGQRTHPREPLAAARERCDSALGRLPARLRSLQNAPDGYRVDTSPSLAALVDEMRSQARKF
jgi:nicotinate phosphoribosyltransferase